MTCTNTGWCIPRIVPSPYTWTNDGYGRPAIFEFEGHLASVAVPGVTIDWARVLAGLPSESA